ncbi:MAG: PEP-CTERM sorting domain-containing protein [Planctomycetes bacterium]|nr:PEP-CTERM sorting domain-containing protein [Planctomycetota bacterium]
MRDQRNRRHFPLRRGPVFQRSTLYANIIPSFNAGRGDLAAQPVPEPLTLAGAGLGLGCLAAYLRRRRGA